RRATANQRVPRTGSRPAEGSARRIGSGLHLDVREGTTNMSGTKLLSLSSGIALAIAATVGSPGRADAAVCGNNIVESGEQCDHGSNNGIDCCDTTCHNVPSGGGCIPNASGYDSCHQGTCNGTHTCQPTSPAVDPCTLTSTCQQCVSTGSLTANFTCTGGSAADGTGCTSGSDHCKVCSSGTCTGTKVCDQLATPGNACRIMTCTTSTGACDVHNLGRGTLCNDGNPCTQNESCSSGNCAGSGIVNVTSGTACDDKNDCTTGETCNGAGTCNGGTNVASGTACDDFNDCIDNTTCDGSGHCTGGTLNATGTACNPTEPGASILGNSCQNQSTCQNSGYGYSYCVTGTRKNDGADCTNGDPCNTGFCSAGN